MSPQSWESSTDNLAQLLGEQLAHLRQVKGLSLRAASCESLLDITSLKNIEQVVYGYGGPLGIMFQSYLNYASYLGVTIPDLFDATLLQQVERNRPGRDLCDEDAFELVQEAFQILKDRGDKITQEAMCRIVRLNRARLAGYPRTRALIESILVETYAKERERRSSEMLERVRDAVNQLKALGLPVTKIAVSKLIGIHPKFFKFHPQVLELLPQNSQHFRAQEDELLAEIETIKRQLEEQGKFVTQIAIAEQIRIPLRTLMKYPSIRTIMKKVAAQSYHHRFGSGRRQRARHDEE